MQLYDKGDYEGATALFEEALVEYYKADVDCRALCQGPQKFEGQDHLRYRYSLHEVVSGKKSGVLSRRRLGSSLPFDLCFALPLFTAVSKQKKAVEIQNRGHVFSHVSRAKSKAMARLSAPVRVEFELHV